MLVQLLLFPLAVFSLLFTETDKGEKDGENDEGEKQEDKSKDDDNKSDEDDKKDFKPITSQDALDDVMAARLRRQDKKLREDLRKEIEADIRRKAEATDAETQGNFKKLYEEQKKDLETLKAASEKANLDALRQKIGAKHQLPDSIIERLAGGTEAEMEVDAKALAKDFGKKKVPATDLGDKNKGTNVPKRAGEGAKERKQQRLYSFQTANDVPWDDTGNKE